MKPVVAYDCKSWTVRTEDEEVQKTFRPKDIGEHFLVQCKLKTPARQLA